MTGNLRKLYVKAYLGINTDKPPKYWLVFKATVPPMGWNTYFVSKPTGTGENCIPLEMTFDLFFAEKRKFCLYFVDNKFMI